MKFIKYILWYLFLIIIKPITGSSLNEINDGAIGLSMMTIKQIKKILEGFIKL